jgi:hypothetical protein
MLTNPGPNRGSFAYSAGAPPPPGPGRAAAWPKSPGYSDLVAGLGAAGAASFLPLPESVLAPLDLSEDEGLSDEEVEASDDSLLPPLLELEE